MSDKSEEINSTAGGSNVPRLPHNGLSMEPIQARQFDPSEYENDLADAIEDAYAQNIHTLDKLVEHLNKLEIKDPTGAEWSEGSFTKTIKELADK